MALSSGEGLLMERLALLLGLLGGPGLLLAMGHHLRRRRATAKHLFWGGVIGHSLGLMITIFAMLSPPNSWEAGGQLRTLLVHWSMVVGLAVGMVAATVLWRRGPDELQS